MMRKNKWFAVVLAVALVAGGPLLSAAEAGWQFAGWFGGGCYPAIIPDAKVSGRFYLISDVAGVWRSDDRGSKWSFKTSGIENLNTATLAIAPTDSNVLYNGTQAGIHKSTDAGNTWRFLESTRGKITFKRPENYRAITVDRGNASKVYAGNLKGEIFVSGDGGSTWARLGSASLPFGSAVHVTALYHSTDRRWLFASSKLGVLRYDLTKGNAGSWSKVLTANVPDLFGVGSTTAEVLYAAAGNKVAWTKDDGATWSYSSAVPTGTVFRVAVSGSKVLVGWMSGWSGGAFLSSDGGKSWTDVERGLVHDVVGNPTRVWTKGFQRPNSVAIDPFNSSVLYYTDWWGVWRSDDNGSTWIERVKGAPNTVGSDICVTAGSIYVATMDNGIVRSTDGGVSYKANLPASGYTSSNYLGHVWRILCWGNKLVVSSAPWDVKVNQIAISNDAGTTWTLVRTGLPATRPVTNTVWHEGYIRALAADPKNSSRLYLGMDGDDGGGFFVSTNGGSSWTRSAGQPASKRIYNGLAVDPLQPSRLYWGAVGAGGGVYKSENYGGSWTKTSLASTYVFDVATASDGTVYAATDNAGPTLYVSRNGGGTWSALKKFPSAGGSGGACEAITIDPKDPKRIAVATTRWDHYAGSGVYLTKDGGSTWTDLTSDLPRGLGAADMAFSMDGQYLYITRYAGSVYRYALSGTALPSPPPPPPSGGIAPTAPTGLLAAYKGGSQVATWWNASTDDVGVTGYDVLRNGVKIGTAASTSFTDNAAPSGSVQYQVKAYDAEGNRSSGSNVATIAVTGTGGTTTGDTQAPSAPSGLLAAYKGGSQVVIWWNAASDDVGVAGYDVLRNGVKIATASGTSFTDNAAPSGSVQYQVKAYDAAGNRSSSSNVTTISVTGGTSGTGDTQAPTAPTGLLAAYKGGSHVVIWWNGSTDNKGVAGYDVFRNGAKIATSSGTSFNDYSAPRGTTAQYHVKAYDAAGNRSAASNTTSIKVG